MMHHIMRAAVLLAATMAGTSAFSATAPTCGPDPLQGRSLYLRGSFNSWNATDEQRFTWVCNRYELVARLTGEHKFKLGDEGWSADADWGASKPDETSLGQTLKIRGQELRHRFTGNTRITLTMPTRDANSSGPTLALEACPVQQAPLGETVLFLRGTMNNWAAQDDYAFQFSCDAYYLNVKLNAAHDFKIGDASWKDASTFGNEGASLVTGGKGNIRHTFAGEQTLRLALDSGKPVLNIGPKTFADPNARSVTDPLALSLRFDSRNLTHKAPFGAITPGTPVQFSVAASSGVSKLTLVVEKRRLEGNQEVLQYTEVARLPMTRVAPESIAASADKESAERWIGTYTFSDISIYGYWFEAQIGEQTFVLHNNRDPVFWTREKGSGGIATVDNKPGTPSAIRRFRQTVYSPDFKVPDWAPDIVYYYIFPERFRNGNPANDPKPGVTKYHDHTVELHPRWNELPYRPGSGDAGDNHFNNDFFGGDLAGIIEKLDYIKELGANTIYMTPIFQAASNHKYDTADYKNIDKNFGSNADFERLTKEAAKRGIRVIPDASLNHTGSDSVYFNRFGNYGTEGAFQNGKINPSSPYASWYSFDASQSNPDKQYKGWVDVSELPELNKASPAWRNYAFKDKDSVMKTWLDKGAAGWRMDVAPWVPDDFWREWRTSIKTHRPDALTISETWFDASKYFLGDMFDSTMNYIFRNAVLEYAGGGNATKLYPNIEQMREAYPPQALYALMNLLSSHDQARAVHQFGWHSEGPNPTTDPVVIKEAKQRLKLAVLFQMTFPGAPTVYYGDEVAVPGGDDPYNRATYPWADLGGKPDTNMLAEFKRLIKLRKDHAVLRRGSISAPLYLDANCIVLLRELGNSLAITATNNADQAHQLTVHVPARLNGETFVNAFTGATITASQGQLQLTVPALYGAVFFNEKVPQRTSEKRKQL